MKVKERLENSSMLKELEQLNASCDLSAVMNVVGVTDET